MIGMQSCEKVDRLIAVQFPNLDLKKTESVKPISATETRYTLVFSDEDQKTLDRLKEVTSHSHFNASWSQLYIVTAKEYLRHHDPLLKKSRKATQKHKQSAHDQIAKSQPTDALSREKTEIDPEISVSQPRTAARKALSRTEKLRDTQISRWSQELHVTTEQNSGSASEPHFANAVYKKMGSASEPHFASASASAKNTEPLPASVRNQIIRRDDGCCTYNDLITDKRCGSRSFVEVDHIVPRALGGSNDQSNLRLLCRAHNIMTSRKVFGVWPGSSKALASIVSHPGLFQRRRKFLHTGDYARA
jgi:hypothetical protein